INLERVDPEALAHGILDLVDVNAINRAGPRTLVAADARRQIEAMKPTIARLHRHRQLGILVSLGESSALIRLEEIPERHIHALANSLDGQNDVAKPSIHAALAAKAKV